ncbi:hypothetical protein LINPERHAP1_LOCUS31093 [Linum perenne]
MNLSGMNEFGWFHVVGSLPIAHALTRICAPLGTVNPQIFRHQILPFVEVAVELLGVT